ncbi:MAG: ribonucleoside-diphosphate reductase subunit alpha, partial [Candidatus Margulisiibacteriota bacterium]|nr:ribonucleoside-diphosphate reductase subunit alpha [Candidatus Margulisiibacteriota bacterium]
SKWIDQSASTNIFVNSTSGKYLNDIYSLAWTTGLKTTYYLRSLGATQISKATSVDEAAENEPSSKERISATAVSMTKQSNQPASNNNSSELASASVQPEVMMCKLNDPSCEACQ